MKRNLLLVLLGVMLMPFPAMAGIYGTLSGRVTDNEGKGLVGATVVIEGTTRGARTKSDGKYTITGINAGTWKVKFSFTGFKPITKQVTISPDQVSDLNAKLLPEAFKTGEIVVIDSDPTKMVDEKKIGTTRTNKGSDNVKIARENVQDVAALSAGIQTDNSGFVIRGGRSTQTQIRVDGLDVGDQFTGGFGSAGVTYSPTVSSFAVEEVQVLSGGFGAEYGNALGGVVNTVVKTGRTNAYEGALRYRTDVPSLFGKANNGIRLEGKLENQYDANVGGPIPLLDGSTFFFAGKYATEKFRTNRLGVIDPIGNNLGQMPNTQSWVRNLTGRLKFVLGSTGITLNVGGQLGSSTVEDGGWDWLYAKDVSVKNLRQENGRIVGDTTFIPEGRAKSPVYNQNINNVFARINHQITNELFYEFTVSLNSNISKNGKRSSFEDNPGFLSGIPIYEPLDEFIADKDPSDPFKMKAGKNKAIDVFEFYTAEQTTSDGATKRDFALRNHLTGYIEGGADVSGTQNAYGLSGYFNQHGNERVMDFRNQNFWQFDGNFNALFETGEVKHTLKTGFELRLYENRRHYNSLPWDANGFFDIYTDEFGGNIYADNQKVFNETSKPKRPWSGSFFVQDQITYRGIIINPGLRFDVFDPNSVYRPFTGNFSPITASDTFPTATLKSQISPRISIAYPVSERTNLSLSYGIYFQMPQMNYLYDAFNVAVLRGNSILGNPNQNAQRTNQYQVSINHQLSDNFAFDVVAYYKDSYNLVGLAYVPVTPTPYYQYVVAEYGTSRGIELTLSKRPTDHIGLNLNYTLAFSNTSSSGAETNYGVAIDPYTNRASTTLSEYPFSNDRRHYVKAIIDFVWGKDEGPSIGGIKLLENTNINFTTIYRTGTPFTLLSPSGGIPIGDINGNRHPSFTQTDMRLQKTFYMSDFFGDGAGNTSIDIFVDILNIFNLTDPYRLFDRSNDPDFDNSTLNRFEGDFSNTTWFKQASSTDAVSTRSDQYDRFGNRLYSTQADFNGDGAVTQHEKFLAYQQYVKDYQQLRVNYQAPRQVFVGAMIRF